MYTVIGMNSICNPNLKHKGVQFLEVSRVYKHLRFTPVPLTNPKITFEVFKIWKQKTIFVVKSQMTQFFEDSLKDREPNTKTIKTKDWSRSSRPMACQFMIKMTTI